MAGKMPFDQRDRSPESSGDDDEFILTKLLKKDQYKLQEPFRLDVEESTKYLTAMKALTDSLQSVAMSGTSYHFDAKRQVPYSGWRYLTGYLKKVEFVGKNKAEADSLTTIFDKIGFAEEKLFAYIRNPEEQSNLYLASGAHRKKIDEIYLAIQKSLKTCNRRIRKVEKAAIVQDLRDQCAKYKSSVMRLDAECREMENYTTSVRNSRPFHHQHIKKSLYWIRELAKEKKCISKPAAVKEKPSAVPRTSGNREKSANQEKSMAVNRSPTGVKRSTAQEKSVGGRSPGKREKSAYTEKSVAEKTVKKQKQ